jgi:hypothetical protein
MATPTITKTDATEIFTYQANVKASVESDGGETITERGFVYGTSPNPVI